MLKTKSPVLSRPVIVEKLKLLQRQRTVVIKSRIMQMNRLQAVIAGTLGYSSSLAEADRTKKFKEAADLIERVNNGEDGDFPFRGIVVATMLGIKAFTDEQEEYEAQMVRITKMLPVAKWVEHKDQLGFGIKSLGIIIGETGDLWNYAGPAKVWKRMGCAPWEYDGKTLMGSTWRMGKEGKLPAEEWERYAYQPRRRSLMYVIGEGLIKQNLKTCKDGGNVKVTWCGPYRAKYDEAKNEAVKTHDAWTACVCKGTGKSAKGGKCSECSGKGKKLLRCHRHGMLVASKLLLKTLWQQWRK